ncbi:hypothetical protein CDAR_620231 [Caerostris darwini]|uniref:Uncharacterized protein n=1 Tax=Caerostris darwini TaxID=1538125 RepID=A0AAV4VLL7_9ARAC|nr:hypothetical protein CDAR_620231 [Caerostris darwini]
MVRSRNVFWYSDPEFPKMGFRGTSSIKKYQTPMGGCKYYGWKTVQLSGNLRGPCNSQHSFLTSSFSLPLLQHFILFRIGGGCSATMCKKRVLIPNRITRQCGVGGGDRVELSGTQEEGKKNYPVGE